MITILCRIPNMNDATSYYRAMGPLAAMKKHSNLNLVFVDSFTWATITMADILFVQRPSTSQDLQLIEYAKLLGVPVWIDYDDDLFSVPTENPAYQVYANPETQKNIAKMIHLADQVTVSTEYLKQRLAKLNSNITVINNAFNDEVIRYKEETPKPRNKIALWRGSPTHQKDVMQVTKEINELSHQHADVHFEFMGDTLWFLTDSMPKDRTIIAPALDIAEYHKHIYEIAPLVMMVPLQFNVFNRSKSNIAWMEAAFAGAVTIAPAMDEWKKPGVLQYKTPEEFGDLLDGVLDGSIDAASNVTKSWEYIQEHLLLRNVNKLRFDVVDKLLNGKKVERY